MSDLKEAVRIIREGGIVIFPTDTAFGIGCRIDDENAVKRLFEIRKRPLFQAVPVLVSDATLAQNYWDSPIPDNVRRLITEYWPGALTVVYHSHTTVVPSLVRGGGTTLGLRMPDHQIALSLIRGVGVPVLGPSANFHGQETPYSYNQLDPKLLELVDYTLAGKCQTGKVSTVVDCTQEPPKVLRQGALRL